MKLKLTFGHPVSIIKYGPGAGLDTSAEKLVEFCKSQLLIAVEASHITTHCLKIYNM